MAMFLVALAAGCVADEAARREMRDGYDALEQRQFDRALASADGYLKQFPRGPAAAEACYLRGQALERRPAGTRDSARDNFAAALRSYEHGLSLRPGRDLRGRLLAASGNASYWLDDYAAALEAWREATPLLDSEDSRAMALYRSGLAQQRLGRFADADETFRRVQSDYPETSHARLARQKQGARSFHVQVGLFDHRGNAESLAADVRRAGFVPDHAIDARGRHVVSVGPYGTFAQAQTARARLAGRFPDAFIVP